MTLTIEELQKKYGGKTTTESPPQTGWSQEERTKFIAELDLQDKMLETPKQEGFFSKVGKFGLDVLKSGAETALRTTEKRILAPFDPTGKGISQLIPEKVNLPILGETSLKYSEEPKEYLMQLGEDILNVLPGSAETKTAVKLAEEGAKGFSGKLIKSAFKVSINDLKKKPELIKDFLVERLRGLTKSSILKKAEAGLNEAESQLEDIISKNKEKVVDAYEVVQPLKKLEQLYRNSAFPEMADTILKKATEFMERGKIPVEELQQFKRNTYRVLKESSYGQMIGAEKEYGKQIARGAKEALENAIPEIKKTEVNKKLAIYGKAVDLMERQIKGMGKNQLIPLQDIILTGTTQSVWPTVVRMVIESVPFKTYVANVLTSTKTQFLKNALKSISPAVKELFND